jgi:hypothetical protein
VGWAGQEAEDQWGEGERPVGDEKRKWAAASLKTGAGPNSSNKTFLNFYLEFEFLATLEICTRIFRRNLTWEFFLKSSRFSIIFGIEDEWYLSEFGSKSISEIILGFSSWF